MSNDVKMVINIVGVALILTLVLKYSTQVQGLISSGTQGFSQAYSAVTMQNIPQAR